MSIFAAKITKPLLFFTTLLVFSSIVAQNLSAQSSQETSSIQKEYLTAQKKLGRDFSSDFYPKFVEYNSLPEKEFTTKIEKTRLSFHNLLKEYSDKLDTKFIESEQIGIRYYFDKLLLDFPSNYYTYTGKKTSLSLENQKKLQQNLADFNKPTFLTNNDFTEYIKSYLRYAITEEIKKSVYQKKDNQRLNAAWHLISKLFKNQDVVDYWKYDYLYNHIDNLGVKNIETLYKEFKTDCKNPVYLNKISELYDADYQNRKNNLVKTYKKIGNIGLDIHLFLPKEETSTKFKKPTIVFFHGGSWTEGKPDYFFEAGERYAQMGWAAAAVEYRLYERNNTLPFEAVMDAKSAIRWLRKNADEFGIDPEKIIATGNSAGGHLVLASALVKNWNEKTDDLNFSSIPNVLLINAGVFDLTDDKTAWIRRNLKDKNLAKEISPNHLLKTKLPPTLIIHGTSDGNVPFSTAETFKKEADKLGIGENIKFYTLRDAPHYIWFDPRYSKQVSKIREDFLKDLGF